MRFPNRFPGNGAWSENHMSEAPSCSARVTYTSSGTFSAWPHRYVWTWNRCLPLIIILPVHVFYPVGEDFYFPLQEITLIFPEPAGTIQIL